MKRSLLVILYFLIIIVIGAIADALFDNGSKVISHSLHAIEIGLCLICAVIFKITIRELLAFMLSYIFLRLAIFDISYNITRGLDLFYIGSTSLYDKFFAKVGSLGIATIKVWALALGCGISLKELK